MINKMSLIDHDYCLPSLTDHTDKKVKLTDDEETSDNSNNDILNSPETSRNDDKRKNCFSCQREFANQYTLNRHLRAQHGVTVNGGNRLLCPLQKCRQSFAFMDLLRNHLKIQHLLEIHEGIILNFHTFEMFLEWKNGEEKRTYTKFVRPHGKYLRHDGSEVHQFHCHRSGIYSPEGKGIRKLKSHGSCKMGSVCPATITAYKLAKNDAVDCKYFPTHLGHFTDLEELYFTSEERNKVNKMVAEHKPFQTTLNEVKSWFSTEIVNNSTDLDTKMTAYIGQWEDIKDIMVENVSILRNGEATCVLMNSFQEEMLKIYANDGLVCISSVKTADSQFYLTVIYTLNSQKDVIPCVFCLSRSLDVEMYTELMEAIKNRVGKVKTKYLMVENCDILLEVWMKTMEISQPPLLLFCSWFVDGEWRKNFNKITGKVSQKAEFYKALRVLLKETDRVKFQALSASFLHHLHSKNTEPFRIYLEKEWMNQTNKWSSAFRDKEIISLDTEIGALHKKFVSLCSNPYSLDAILFVLLRICRDFKVNSVTDMKQAQKNAVLTVVKKFHHSCVLSPYRNVMLLSDGKWLVQTSEGDFVVFKLENGCDCWWRCDLCNVCVHCFNCSCSLSSGEAIICEHIHLVGRYLNNDADVSCNGLDLRSSDAETQTADEIAVEIANLSQQIAVKAQDISDVATLQCLRDNLKLILCASTPLQHLTN